MDGENGGAEKEDWRFDFKKSSNINKEKVNQRDIKNTRPGSVVVGMQEKYPRPKHEAVKFKIYQFVRLFSQTYLS